MDAEIDAVVGQSIALFAPSAEFLTSPYDPQKGFCVLRGTIPPGGAAPLCGLR